MPDACLAPVGTTPASPPPTSNSDAGGNLLWEGLAAAGRPLDGLLRRIVGEENDILRYFLWVVFAVLLFAAGWLATNNGWRRSAPEPAAELKLREITPQTVVGGKPLTVAATPENAEFGKASCAIRLPARPRRAPPSTQKRASSSGGPAKRKSPARGTWPSRLLARKAKGGR